MTQDLISTLRKLYELGYSKHIYQVGTCWYHAGELLANAEDFVYDFWHDENDLRIYIHCITCNDIKGVAITN